MTERDNGFTWLDAEVLERHLKELFDVQLQSVRETAKDAKDILARKLEGFPAEYASRRDHERLLDDVREMKVTASNLPSRSEHDSVIKDIRELREGRSDFATREEHDLLKELTHGLVPETDFNAMNTRVNSLESDRDVLSGKASNESVVAAQREAVIGRYIAMAALLVSAGALVMLIVLK
jgi:uncharacterized coiled-coil DUF342 family protein